MTLIPFNRLESARWSPLDRLSSLHDDLDRLFDLVPFGKDRELFGGWSPALDLWQDHDAVHVRVELPGLSKEDIHISLHDGALLISGERKQEETVDEGKTYRSERFFGKFQRSVALPTLVDASKVKASYQDGILEVTLPKAEEVKPKKIDINVK